MKRQIATLERKVALLEKKTWSELPAATPDADDSQNIRFFGERPGIPPRTAGSHRG